MEKIIKLISVYIVFTTCYCCYKITVHLLYPYLIDSTHLAKQKNIANAEFYKAEMLSKSNKVRLYIIIINYLSHITYTPKLTSILTIYIKCLYIFTFNLHLTRCDNLIAHSD